MTNTTGSLVIAASGIVLLALAIVNWLNSEAIIAALLAFASVAIFVSFISYRRTGNWLPE